MSTTLAAAAPRLGAYAALDLRRQLRDTVGMFFTVGLPAFMYLVFGLGSEGTAGSGNVAMYVMVSMAAYGAVTATTTVAGSAATEQLLGWGRQLALTPMRPLQFIAIKSGVALAVSGMTIGLIYAIGAATGARATTSDWLWSAGIAWGGSAMFAIYGLAVCLLFRGPGSVGIASGMVAILAFLGNVFTPMSGLVLDLGRLTPLYGFAGLARYPMTSGRLPTGDHDPLWLLVANVLTWTVVFTALAVLGVRRSRHRL